VHLVRDLYDFRQRASKLQHESKIRTPEQFILHLSLLGPVKICTINIPNIYICYPCYIVHKYHSLMLRCFYVRKFRIGFTSGLNLAQIGLIKY